MHIEKIIKFYFLFVMVICSTVAVGSDKTTQTFMANVLGFNSVEHSVAEVDNRKVDFEISRNKDVLSIIPGSTNVDMMKISFRTHDDEMVVNGLKLKVFGVLSDNVGKAVLKSGDDVLADGQIENGYISFGNVGHKIDKNSEGVVSVFLDVSRNLKAGERIRLDLQDQKDIYMIVGGRSFDLKTSYPIKGKSLSVVSSRSWIPGYDMPKRATPVKK